MLIQCTQCKRRYKLSDLKLDLLQTGPTKLQCPNCRNVFIFSQTTTADKEEVVQDKQTQYHAIKADPAPQTGKREKLIEQFILLRTVVGFLGEKQQFGWWDTNFLSSTGLKYLEITFPRSVFSAAITSVTEAAKRVHDNRIGKGHVYHLFRLPLSLEQQIHSHLQSDKSDKILSDISDRKSALNVLKSVANGDSKQAEGPIQAGTENDLYKPLSIKQMAKHYIKAFEDSKEVFPYFVG